MKIKSRLAHKVEPIPQKMRVGRLKKPIDIAKYLARCIRKVETGGDPNKYYKLAMMASILLKSLEVATYDERLAKIESTIKKDDYGS